MRDMEYYKGKEKIKFILPESMRRNVRKAYLRFKYKGCDNGVLPDFLVIGQMKCGTSSLYYYLTKHPQVLEAVEKEVNYFNFNYELGTDFYRKNFPTLEEVSKQSLLLKGKRVITGEATPEYLLHPLCPARVRNVLPKAKLIVIMRDPVERAFSHFKHAQRFGMEKLDSFEKAINVEFERTKYGKMALSEGKTQYSYPFHQFSYLERGLYKEQIDRWLKYYSLSDFLFIKLEDLQKNPKKTVNKVFNFLELEDFELDEYPNRFLGKQGEMSKEVREKLQDYFYEPNRSLEELIGISW